VGDAAEASASDDEAPGDFGIDHGGENENFDLRLDFRASRSANLVINSCSVPLGGQHALGLIFGFFVLKGFTYSARYTSPDVERVGEGGNLLPRDSGASLGFWDCSLAPTVGTVDVRGGTFASRGIPMKAFRTDGNRKDRVNVERVEAVPSEREST